jgi:hypothetical protein
MIPAVPLFAQQEGDLLQVRAGAYVPAGLTLRGAYTFTAAQSFSVITASGAISAVGLSSSSGLTVSSGTTAVQALTCTTVTASGSGVFGAAALLASERLRVAGGTMGTPGATDVLLAAGRVYAGDTSATSIQTAGGITAVNVDVTSYFVATGTGSDTVGAGPRFGLTNNLLLQRGSATTDFWHWNGSSWNKSAQIVSASGQFKVLPTTASTSTATGALTVAGGLGVAGQITFDGATGLSLRVTNGTANAAVATTLGSVGPTGSTAGNPQGWLRISVAGTDRFIPYW